MWGPFNFGTKGAAGEWGPNTIDAIGKAIAGFGALVVAEGRSIGGAAGSGVQAGGAAAVGLGLGLAIVAGWIKDIKEDAKQPPGGKPGAQTEPPAGNPKQPGGYPKPDDLYYPQVDGSDTGGPAGLYSMPTVDGGPMGPLFYGSMPTVDGGPMGPLFYGFMPTVDGGGPMDPKSFNVGFIIGPFAEGPGTKAFLVELGTGHFGVLG